MAELPSPAGVEDLADLLVAAPVGLLAVHAAVGGGFASCERGNEGGRGKSEGEWSQSSNRTAGIISNRIIGGDVQMQISRRRTQLTRTTLGFEAEALPTAGRAYAFEEIHRASNCKILQSPAVLASSSGVMSRD